mmetsp:Transcript_24716/g.32267  ORF Transcript_24716/g.32267 Transcript_24716/m.32267 type:complete len:90 (-) Transcript_24716:881-1150(-)
MQQQEEQMNRKRKAGPWMKSKKMILEHKKMKSLLQKECALYVAATASLFHRCGVIIAATVIVVLPLLTITALSLGRALEKKITAVSSGS